MSMDFLRCRCRYRWGYGVCTVHAVFLLFLNSFMLWYGAPVSRGLDDVPSGTEREREERKSGCSMPFFKGRVSLDADAEKIQEETYWLPHNKVQQSGRDYSNGNGCVKWHYVLPAILMATM